MRIRILLMVFAMGAPSAFGQGGEGGSGGGSGSHGGGGFACIDAGNVIHSVESQDLWEAEHVQRWPLAEWAGEERTIALHVLDDRLKLVDENIYLEARPALLQIYDTKDRLKDLKIEEIKDDHREFSKDSCPKGEPKFVQIASYRDQKFNVNTGKLDTYTLVYSAPLFAKMVSEAHRAAVDVHEALFAVFRKKYGDTGSERARLWVGMLFSKLEISEIKANIAMPRFSTTTSRSTDEKTAELLYRFKQITASQRPEQDLPVETDIPASLYFYNSAGKVALQEVVLEGKGRINRKRTQISFTFSNRAGNYVELLFEYEKEAGLYRQVRYGGYAYNFWYKSTLKPLMKADRYGDLIVNNPATREFESFARELYIIQLKK